MKNFCKIALTSVLCLMLIVAVSFSAFASSVSYDDVSEKFIFSTTSKENPTDLFENFKDAMPGDTLTQEIELSNMESNRMSVRFWLKSTGATKESEELLSKMTLTVKAGEKTPFFNAPANETSSLTDWVDLGTLYEGGSVKLTVTLSIPATIGNEFMGAKAELDWHFKAEEQPIDTKKPEDSRKCPVCGKELTRKLVKGADGKWYYYYVCEHEHTTPPVPVTGEFVNFTLPVAIMVFSALGICVVLYVRKRKKSIEN